MSKKSIIIKTAKIATPIALVCFTGAITFRIVKEYKRQLKQLEEDANKLAADKEQEIKETKEKLAETEENLRHEVFDNIDITAPTGNIVENQEFEEMRKRFGRTPMPPVDTANAIVDGVRQGKSVDDILKEEADKMVADSNMKAVTNEEHIKTHNAFEDNVVLPTDNKPVSFDEVKEKMLEKSKEKENESNGEQDMNYEPNSHDAWNAYVNNKIIDLEEDQTFVKDTIERYNLPYPMNPALDTLYYLRGLFHFNVHASFPFDENIIATILEDRRQFFGLDSIYSNTTEVSFAEVIIYWANFISDDVHGAKTAWIHQWMSALYLYDSNLTAYALQERIQSVMDNTYISENGKGMFELSEDEVISQGTPRERRMLDDYNMYVARVINDDNDLNSVLDDE